MSSQGADLAPEGGTLEKYFLVDMKGYMAAMGTGRGGKEGQGGGLDTSKYHICRSRMRESDNSGQNPDMRTTP